MEKKEISRMIDTDKINDIEFQFDFQNYRLVFRTLTNSTNERTLITTILPPNVFFVHSLNSITPIKFNGHEYVKTISYQEMMFLCGIFNSFVVDFIFRHRIATNLNMFHMKDTPIPKYSENNKLHKNLVDKTTKLVCTTTEYDELRAKLNIHETIKDEQRLGYQAQINAMSAKIYDLTRKELELILQNFPSDNLNSLKKETLNEFDML